MPRFFRGTLLNPSTPERALLLEDGGLLVDDDGTILAAGAREEIALPEGCETVDFSNYLVMPGFVDTHCHVAQARAVNVRHASLLEWLSKVVFPMESAYSADVAIREAPDFFHRLLATGTTTVGLYVTVNEDATDAVFAVAESVGIRGVIGKVMMDQHSPPALQENTAASLAASQRLCEMWHGQAKGRLRYAFTPRFALTCSAELLREAGAMAAEYKCHVATHVAENKAEVARAAELFPEARSYLDIYDRAGLLGPRTILGHGIYLDEKDWDVMAATGTGLAHCPVSNILLESGILDLAAPMSRGVAVGLGSDIGAGSDPALTEVAESAISGQIARKVLGHSHRVVTPELAFYLLTRGGAEAMGLADEIGDFRPGKQADFVVFDPRECLPMAEWTPEMDAASLLYAILLRFRATAVRATFVQGRRVYPSLEA
ncbi:MAG: guanine deaminase [Candidatus Lernaella stagnicola]|nr:guanine deaminase [Candidatus Lernaella stagnicola]